jgi:hypothetical protein
MPLKERPLDFMLLQRGTLEEEQKLSPSIERRVT